MIRKGFTLLFLACLAGSFFYSPHHVAADAAADIQAQIDAHNSQIASLEAEIAAYQKQLDTLGSQKNTLQSAINSLAISQKQLASKIQVTQNNIAWANKQIQQLSLSIGDKEVAIATDEVAIGKALRSVAEGEQTSLVADLFSTNSFSDAWKVADEVLQFNRALKGNIADLQSARVTLTTNRDKVNAEKAKLVSLQNDLALQKRSVDASKATQGQLLAQTKNQESNYQNLIKQKQAAEKSFEQDLVRLQGQLNLIVHPNLLPKVGTGVLSWPFSLAFMNNCAQRKSVFDNLFCVTQYFGNTAFSTANAQIYNGHGHNAIDIGAPIGTPILAALSGTVLATGNTDLVSGCYSFGKWVMLQHGNGLNTLYSHLSTIDVGKGQQVVTGQVLGLSGMTGYATGPHLHFGVYASEGTEIMTLQKYRGATTPCANAAMPVATLTAYLNPLSYL
jgi:murein DD-endopeptidase MepM/ murein hydrolase activator NlpD